MFNLCQTLIRHNLPNICKSSMQAPPEFSKQDRPLKPILARQRAVSSAMFKISPVLINTLLQRGVHGRREASGVQSSKFGSWLFSGCWLLALGSFPFALNLMSRRTGKIEAVNGHSEAFGVQSSKFKVQSSRFKVWILALLWL